jgi:DNA-directed RNA polymerase specialized sigma24 family protein
MSKLSEDLPPDIAELFDKPGRAWPPEERHRVQRWLAEDPQTAKRLQDIAQKHLRRPQSMQSTDMAADVVQAYLTKSFDNLCNHYDPCPAEFLVKHVRDFGRLLDKLCQPPEALAAFLREHLQEATRQVLMQWPPLRDVVVADLNQVLDEPSFYTAERFATVKLQDKTRKFLSQHRSDAHPRRLNRMLLTDAYQECLIPARDFLGYLFACLQRYCRQLKLTPEMSGIMVDGQRAEGDRSDQGTTPWSNIHMNSEEGAAELTKFTAKFGDTLAQLPPEDRWLILMYYFFHMSLARYAAAFNISEDNAKVRRFRACLKLKRLLLKDAYFQELLEDIGDFLEFIHHYWKLFSDSILQRFASGLNFLQGAAEDEGPEDAQEKEVM